LGATDQYCFASLCPPSCAPFFCSQDYLPSSRRMGCHCVFCSFFQFSSCFHCEIFLACSGVFAFFLLMLSLSSFLLGQLLGSCGILRQCPSFYSLSYLISFYSPVGTSLNSISTSRLRPPDCLWGSPTLAPRDCEASATIRISPP